MVVGYFAINQKPTPIEEVINVGVNSEIVYKRDGKDTWQSPRDTLLRGEGDCEDYAVLKAYRLLHAGISPTKLTYVIVTGKEGKNYHAILKYVDNGVTKYLDNNNDFVYNEQSFSYKYLLKEEYSLVGKCLLLDACLEGRAIKIKETLKTRGDWS
jgi:predicted transglutaminase-like cysteine proteinase